VLNNVHKQLTLHIVSTVLFKEQGHTVVFTKQENTWFTYLNVIIYLYALYFNITVVRCFKNRKKPFVNIINRHEMPYITN
jgi:hypothetical protein